MLQSKITVALRRALFSYSSQRFSGSIATAKPQGEKDELQSVEEENLSMQLKDSDERNSDINQGQKLQSVGENPSIQFKDSGERNSDINERQNGKSFTTETYNTKFFDNFLILTGVITSKCLYQIDDEDYVNAARFNLSHSRNGPVIVVKSTSREVIEFMLKNIDEGLKVSVKGRISYRTKYNNLSIVPIYIEVL